MRKSNEIEEEAARWLLKRDAGALTEDDERALNEWLEASTANTVAFVRLEAAWRQTGRLKAFSAGTKRGTIPSPEGWQLSPFFDERQASASRLAGGETEGALTAPARVGHLGAGRLVRLAACLVIVFGAAMSWYLWPRGPAYQTGIGGTESVPLTDGSQVTLNTDTRLELDMTQAQRSVQLERGEAFFEVAKDPKRPFVVRAGTKRVIAVGTKFSVQRNGDEVQVVVSEGTVRMEDAPGSPSPSDADRASRRSERDAGSARPALPNTATADGGGQILSGEGVLLPAGTVARAQGDSVLVQEKPVSEVVERYLSWRTGYLVFKDTDLSEAVAEFNRYNTRKIVIQDPALAALKLSGKFRSTNFEAFVRLLHEVLGVSAQHENDEIVLTSR